MSAGERCDLESQLRGYTCIFHKPLVAYEVSEPVFRAITENTGSRSDLFRRYCRLIGVAFGQKIRICDLYAPQTALKPVPPINCKIGVGTLLCALPQFDINCARRKEEFSLKNWVDGKQRPGKRGGAFCSCTHSKHSSLLLSHTDDCSSLFPLAHEMRHGLHFARIDDRQTSFRSRPPMVLADIASTFNQLLLLAFLLKLSAVCRHLCGDAVELLPEHQHDWARIARIFFQPFYCYQ